MRHSKGFTLIEALAGLAVILVVWLLIYRGWALYQDRIAEQRAAESVALELVSAADRTRRVGVSSEESAQIKALNRVYFSHTGFVGGAGQFSGANSGVSIYRRSLLGPDVLSGLEVSNETYINKFVGIAVLPADPMAEYLPKYGVRGTVEMPAFWENVAARAMANWPDISVGMLDRATGMARIYGSGATVPMPRLINGITWWESVVKKNYGAKFFVVLSGREDGNPVVPNTVVGSQDDVDYGSCEVHMMTYSTSATFNECPTEFVPLGDWPTCAPLLSRGSPSVIQTAAGTVTLGMAEKIFKDARRECITAGSVNNIIGCDERKARFGGVAGYGDPRTQCGYDPRTPGKQCGAIDPRRVRIGTDADGTQFYYDPEVAVVEMEQDMTVSLDGERIANTGGCPRNYWKNNSTHNSIVDAFTIRRRQGLCCIPRDARKGAR